MKSGFIIITADRGITLVYSPVYLFFLISVFFPHLLGKVVLGIFQEWALRFKMLRNPCWAICRKADVCLLKNVTLGLQRLQIYHNNCDWSAWAACVISYKFLILVEIVENEGDARKLKMHAYT